jgi:hypothetical protein
MDVSPLTRCEHWQLIHAVFISNALRIDDWRVIVKKKVVQCGSLTALVFSLHRLELLQAQGFLQLPSCAENVTWHFRPSQTARKKEGQDSSVSMQV